MDDLELEDVPYGNDWDSIQEIAAWTAQADRRRPWRVQIRDHMAGMVAAMPAATRVLELGSGPGLLAERVLETCPNVSAYTVMDFSAPMIAACRERLARFPAASFVVASFKSKDWVRRVAAPFDCVLSMQAVHELRHKHHARTLYREVHGILHSPGLIVICDHTPIDATAKSAALYMTEREHVDALAAAGFTNVRVELTIDTLAVYAGDRVG